MIRIITVTVPLDKQQTHTNNPSLLQLYLPADNRTLCYGSQLLLPIGRTPLHRAVEQTRKRTSPNLVQMLALQCQMTTRVCIWRSPAVHACLQHSPDRYLGRLVEVEEADGDAGPHQHSCEAQEACQHEVPDLHPNQQDILCTHACS